MKIDSVQDCMNFFKKGFPETSPKNFRTQMGIFLEEIGETLMALEASRPEDQMMIGYLQAAITQAGEHLKNSDGVIGIKDRVEFLDGLCDVMVTAVGAARHANMDIVGGFAEVNRSNNSKFGEDGEPILDKNLKLIKGPNYSKPDLKIFV